MWRRSDRQAQIAAECWHRLRHTVMDCIVSSGSRGCLPPVKGELP
ncbi:hypothetical protein RBY4I_2957 [Rhodobacterales bacterium Y4I]|nr:hypothetical protein RBY4I_2957 [Rhodobacterales bacterium Y4I]